MTPLEVLKRVSRALQKLKCKYCLIGGHAASLYRTRERFTKDVDFALVAQPISDSRAVAEEAIQSVGLSPMVGFIPHVQGERQRKSVCMITSAPINDELTGIVDILLPVMPWISFAVDRAQYNKIDLGFAKVPTITPEDLIVAKCYALDNNPDRFQDLDDIKELFEGVKDLDSDYLLNRIEELKLSIPKQVRKYAPFKFRN